MSRCESLDAILLQVVAEMTVVAKLREIHTQLYPVGRSREPFGMRSRSILRRTGGHRIPAPRMILRIEPNMRIRQLVLSKPATSNVHGRDFGHVSAKLALHGNHIDTGRSREEAGVGVLVGLRRQSRGGPTFCPRSSKFTLLKYFAV